MIRKVNIKISKENYFDGNAGSSNSTVEEKGWSSLWKTSVPSKIKVFLWRLAKQPIPTADVLAHRNMATSSTCSLCGAEDSWRHSLIECNMANSVWVLSDSIMVEHMIACDERNAKLWLFHLMATLPHGQFTRMVVTLWAIWTAQRKVIHEEIYTKVRSLTMGLSIPTLKSSNHSQDMYMWYGHQPLTPDRERSGLLSQCGCIGLKIIRARSCSCILL
jgi:hypothetical protein